MHLLDLTHRLSTPAENLALDEVLLDLAETGQGGETLFFWEPREVFVVVGYANKVATEVNVAACEKRGVPVFRRCSGGGTVVQMPGGLNYGLILGIQEQGPTRNITIANQYIMKKNRDAIQKLLPPSALSVRGHTDLCVDDLKFAGNSQRRRKNFLLFHGTLLLNCDLSLISELLPQPCSSPIIAPARPHSEFVTNLNLPATDVKNALIQAWNADAKSPDQFSGKTTALAREKYATPEWNLKF